MNEAMLFSPEQEYMTANQMVNAVAGLLEQGKLEQAARLYSHCQEDIGFILMSKLRKDRAVQAALAKMFFMAKDFEKAAMVLEVNEQFARAGELYERTDQYEQAAEMWLKAGDTARAALNYERYGSWAAAADLYVQIGNYEKAAYCFEKAVNHFLAGKYYFQTKKYEKSMELLQKVSKDEENYLEATVLIGNILAMKGYLELALAKYRSVTKSVPLGKGSLSVYYNLAQLLERTNNIFKAIKIYKEIAAISPDFRDVKARIAALEEKMAEQVEVVPAEEGEESLEILEDLEPIEEEELTAAAGPHPPFREPRAQIVSVMEGFEFLKNTSLFDQLNLAEMKRMWTICEKVSFGPGEIIIEQDRPGEALFIIKAGSALVQRVEAGKTATLAELPPGAHVGEMSLVDNAPTSARVVAGSKGAEAFKITRSKFEELLSSDDKIAIKVYQVFIKTLCDRLRKTTSELSALKAERVS